MENLAEPHPDVGLVEDDDSDVEYDVKEVRNLRFEGRGASRRIIAVLIHWEGYSTEDDSWEEVDNLGQEISTYTMSPEAQMSFNNWLRETTGKRRRGRPRKKAISEWSEGSAGDQLPKKKQARNGSKSKQDPQDAKRKRRELEESLNQQAGPSVQNGSYKTDEGLDSKSSRSFLSRRNSCYGPEIGSFPDFQFPPFPESPAYNRTMFVKPEEPCAATPPLTVPVPCDSEMGFPEFVDHNLPEVISLLSESEGVESDRGDCEMGLAKLVEPVLAIVPEEPGPSEPLIIQPSEFCRFCNAMQNDWFKGGDEDLNSIVERGNAACFVEESSSEELRQLVTSFQKILIYKRKGNEFFNRKKYKEAISEYNYAIDEGAKWAPPVFLAKLHANCGAAQDQVGNYTEAIKSCCLAKALDPTYKKAYSRLGGMLRGLGMNKEAIEVFDEFMKLPRSIPIDHEDLSQVVASRTEAEAAAGKSKADLFKLLGLKRECTSADVRKVFRAMSLVFHPDKHKAKIRFARKLGSAECEMVDEDAIHEAWRKGAEWTYAVIKTACDYLSDDVKRFNLANDLKTVRRPVYVPFQHFVPPMNGMVFARHPAMHPGVFVNREADRRWEQRWERRWGAFY